MVITVKDENNEVLYEGDADDFLFYNEDDDDLEIILNKLDNMKTNSSIKAYNSDGNIVTITKIENLIY